MIQLCIYFVNAYLGLLEWCLPSCCPKATDAEAPQICTVVIKTLTSWRHNLLLGARCYRPELQGLENNGQHGDQFMLVTVQWKAKLFTLSDVSADVCYS